MSKIYALLVGINDYSESLGPSLNLHGCINDIERYLSVFHALYRDNFVPETLYDSDATRANIIDQFRKHLGQATDQDTALFVYAGHGERATASKAFEPFAPDGKDEGIVCYDSLAAPDKYMLVDKEMALLIKELEEKSGPHIALILDSCHSGSVTRSADSLGGAISRNWGSHYRGIGLQLQTERPLESYLASEILKVDYPTAVARPGFTIPTADHIVLAACKRTQTAKEENGKGRFSNCLQTILEENGANFSYGQIFSRTLNAMNKWSNQDPQFQPYGTFSGNSLFLGSGAAARTSYHIVQRDSRGKGWFIDQGAINHIPNSSDSPANFNIYNASSSTSDRKLLGSAHAIEVGLQKSYLDVPQSIIDNAGENTTFEAELTSLPLPPMPVFVQGTDEVAQAIKKYIEANPAINIECISERDYTNYEFVTEKEDDKYQIRFNRISDATFIQGIMVHAANHETWEKAIQSLIDEVVKPVVDWERLLALQNYSALNTDKVSLVIQYGAQSYDVKLDSNGIDTIVEQPSGHTDHTSILSLSYPHDIDHNDATGEDDLKVTFSVKNDTDAPIWVLLLYFSNEYLVNTPGISQYYNDPIAPGESKNIFEAPFFLPPLKNEESHWFKAVFSNEKILHYEQLHQIVNPSTGKPSGLELGAWLEAKRNLREEPPVAPLTIDWFTKTCQINILRQHKVAGKEEVAIPEMGLTVLPHDEFSADIKVKKLGVSQRSLDNGDNVYHALHSYGFKTVLPFSKQSFDTKPESPSSKRSLQSNGYRLDLTNIQTEANLEESPLTMNLNLGLGEDEVLLPIAYDGQFFHVVGDAHSGTSGVTQINIRAIPEKDVNQRSLGKALTLYLTKTIFKRNVNKLHWIQFDGDEPTYVTEDLASRVQEAKNILVVLHGIIGSTKSIVSALPGIYKIEQLRNPDNLVLAYDYENLDTPVEETAELLKESLEKVGISVASDKSVSILAHSMGGLVARCLIELSGGNAFVDHLILAGTPNGGSPFGDIGKARRIMKLLATLSINFVPAAAPFAGGLLTVLSRSEKLTKTLEAMSPSSDLFKRKLKSTNDPGIPYTILGGSIDAFEEQSDKFFPMMIDKFGKSTLIDILYPDPSKKEDHLPHDIAVSVDSIHDVNAEGSQATELLTIACHHMNYFTSPEGIAALKKVKWMEK